jgi:alpha-1,3-mannosyltransferase
MLAARVWTAKQGGLLRALKVTPRRALHPEHVLVTLVGCNCVGVLFVRSLHFQFYCWYLHGVPLLLWRCASLPLALKLLTYALLEYAFSYGLDRVEGTSTPASSAALLLAHATILYALCRAEPPPTYADERPPARPLARSD